VPAQINHFFVLMMENRSLDHMLGFMKSPDYDIEGLDPAALPYNEDSGERKIFASGDARPTGDLKADPNHHFPDVVQQLYGTQNPVSGQQPDMSGFVDNYEAKSGSAAAGANIMKCFNPKSLPVLTTLARSYAVCDHWFSSIPGPTLPNRLYVHCGTSRGRLDMAPEYYQGFYTVYEELWKHQVPSCIFWSDWSETLSFSGLMAHENLFYQDYSNFVAMCAGPADHMPAYCFIEPRYHPADLSTGGVLPETDQHPDSDVRDGETLIHNVYNAIRQNDDLWHSSILLIVYDEHGGLYDHVKPVPLPSPDGLSSVNPQFDFKMSGVRVPAVVISPYIRPGTISKTIFDHTSIIATALELFTNTWPTDALYARAQAANTLDSLLDLTMAPRDDWPVFAAPAYGGVIPRIQAAAAAQAPLSDLQHRAVQNARSVNASLPQSQQVAEPAELLHQASTAGAFVQAVGKAAVAAHQGLKV
jgi:phospholipase C